jgi:hypothetical protein
MAVAEQVEITLAKALKLKNRLAGRLAKLDGDFENYNSLPAGTDRPDLKELYVVREALVAQIVQLKVALNSANQPIQQIIFELAEAKSLIALLAKTSTKHGRIVDAYHDSAIEYIAQFRKSDVDREVRRLEIAVDQYQEQLDSFNNRTVVGIGADLLREIEAAPTAL